MRFTGRPVFPIDAVGECVVSRSGFSTLAQFYDAMVSGEQVAHAGDRSAPDIYGRRLTGRLLCIPHAIGSTSAGSTWEHVARTGLAPRAILIAGEIDTLTAAGLAIAGVWANMSIGAVDRLGSGFLAAVESGASARVSEDGTVELLEVDR